MLFRSCEATCGLEITLEGDTIKRIRGDRDDVFSHGFICPKGSTLGALHEDPDRLRRPLIRRNGKHVEVPWEEAFAEVDRRLTPLIATHGPDALAVYIGNPNAHNFANTLAIRPLVKALRTRNVFSASTVDQMPKHVACGLLYGHPFAIPVPDLDRTDFLLLLGANPARVERQSCHGTRLARSDRGNPPPWRTRRRRRPATHEDSRPCRPSRPDPPRD